MLRKHSVFVFLIAFLFCLSAYGQVTITVNTVAHTNTPGDTTISLIEAIRLVNSATTATEAWGLRLNYAELSATEQGLVSADPAANPAGPFVIQFDFGGTGAGWIETPKSALSDNFEWGDTFPPILADNVTIDGYSAPGASANTNPIDAVNNAVIKVVIDARSGAVCNYVVGRAEGEPGYEATIFTTYAKNTVFKGLSILGDDDGPVAIGYGSRQINGFQFDFHDGKVQGCYLGMDPDGTLDDVTDSNVNGRLRRAIQAAWDGLGNPEATPSNPALRGPEDAPVIGTDGDGVDDRGEFNLFWTDGFAIEMWTCLNAKISGNHMGLKKNGTLRTTGICGGFVRPGRAHHIVIGTDGDGVSDENERNYFGAFDDLAIRGRGSSGVMYNTIAGNVIGQDIFGTAAGEIEGSIFYDYSPKLTHIGTNLDGVSDDLEGNTISSILTWNTSDLMWQSRVWSSIGPNNSIPHPSWSWVGNSLTECNMVIREPNRHWAGKVFAPTESGGNYPTPDQEDGYRATLDAGSTYQTLIGSVPYKTGSNLGGTMTALQVDLYVSDYNPAYPPGAPTGFDDPDSFYVSNYRPQGKVYLGSFEVTMPAATGDAPFSIDISGIWETEPGSAFRGQDVYLTACPTWTVDFGSVQYVTEDWYYANGTPVDPYPVTGQYAYDVLVSVPAGPPPTAPPSDSAVSDWTLYE